MLSPYLLLLGFNLLLMLQQLQGQLLNLAQQFGLNFAQLYSVGCHLAFGRHIRQILIAFDDILCGRPVKAGYRRRQTPDRSSRHTTQPEAMKGPLLLKVLG